MVALRLDPAGLVSVASALPLIVLGVLVLGVRRNPQNVFFALFSITWGLQVATANLTRLVTDPLLYGQIFRVTLILYLGTALFLVHFASVHPHRNLLGRRPAFALAPVAIVLPGLVLLLLAPHRLFGTAMGASGPYATYEPLLAPLVFAPFFGSFYYAAVTQARAAHRAETQTGRQRARLVFIALAFFLAYVVSLSFIGFTWPTTHEGIQSPAVLVTNTLLFGGGMLLVVGLIVWLGSARERRDVAMIAALVVPVTVVVAQRLVAAGDVQLETGWFWRLAAVGLLAYAMARYQLFDLDVRYRRAVLAAVPLGVAALTVAVLAAVAEHPSRGWSLPALFVVGLTGNLVAWRYRDRLADRFLLLGSAEPDRAYLDHRRYEVYRDALVLDGALVAPDHPTLVRLRRRLGIGEREHLVLAHAVQQELAARRTGRSGPTQPFPGHRVDRVIGEGAHGRAILASREADGAEVVLKVVGRQVLGGSAIHRLTEEARVLERLHHPHIIGLHGIIETPHEVALVLDHAAGGNLAALLQRRTKVPPRDAVALMRDVLDALEAAHAAGIIHRDLKPENVLLDADGRPLLADFGVAARTGPEATVAPAAGVIGTLLYMAPEQVRGEAVTPQTDLYAAGVLLYTLLTGQPYLPTAGRDDFQLRKQILETVPRLDGVPPSLRPVLRIALAKAPAERHENAAAMRNALEEAKP